MPAFLDPTQPITTCTRESCTGCSAGSLVHCHFQGRDLARFLISMAPPFVVGGAGIVDLGWLWLFPWVGLAVGYFGLLEIRVMCSHCPHYAEPSRSLQCWANYGSPKLWKYRPGPMSRMETFWFFAGMAVILGYPFAFLLLGSQWLLLALFLVTTAAAGSTLRGFLCTQCMNFACPLNATDSVARAAFFANNPGIASAWGSELPHDANG